MTTGSSLHLYQEKLERSVGAWNDHATRGLSCFEHTRDYYFVSVFLWSVIMGQLLEQTRPAQSGMQKV
jgi:hypothetical protein